MGFMLMDKIEARIRQIIDEELGVDSSTINSDELLSDVNIDTDDISFLFIPEIERSFDVKFSVKQWSKVGSINEIVDLIQSTKSD